MPIIPKQGRRPPSIFETQWGPSEG